MPDPEGSAPAPRFILPPSVIRAIPLAVFVAVPSILILPVLFSGRMLYGMDVDGVFHYTRIAISTALRSGRLPVWDPTVLAGFPLLAALQGAVFYPPTWLCLILPAGLFWTLSAWGHQILAGLFAHRWLDRGLGVGRWPALAGAVLFMLSGYFAGHLHAGHVNYVWGFAWIPALLWRLERYFQAPTLKRGILLALVLAMLFLSGVPQFVYVMALVGLGRGIGFVLSAREGRGERLKVAACAGLWLTLGLVLCAPQLLPTLELIREGQRTSIGTGDFVTSYSVAPGNLLTLVTPAFFGDGRETPVWSHGAIWESPGFVGVAGLALASLGVLGRRRQRWFWLGVAVLGVLLALGRYSPVFPLAVQIVPGMSLFRAPSRYLVLFVLAAAALAAMGTERLLNGDERLRRQALGIAAAAGAIALIAGGLRLSLGGEPDPGWWTGLVGREKAAFQAEQKTGAPPASRPAAAHALLWAAVCAAGVAASLLRRPGAVSALAPSLILAGELWVYGSRYFVGRSLEDLEWPPGFVDLVRNHPRYPFRVATVTPDQTPLIGKCQAAGIAHVGGYEPMMLRRYAELVNVARGKPASDPVVAMVLARPGPLFDLLGARLWIVPGPRQEPPGWKTLGQLPSGFVYENPAALPRAFLVGRSINLLDRDERLKFLAGSGFDARRMVVLERDSGGLPDGGESAVATVQLAGMEPGLYTLRTENEADAYLVLSEAWYPGWGVEVDGAPAELLRANHLMQAVRLPTGKHDVRFSYHPRFLGAGFALAAAAALVPLALLALRMRRR